MIGCRRPECRPAYDGKLLKAKNHYKTGAAKCRFEGTQSREGSVKVIIIEMDDHSCQLPKYCRLRFRKQTAIKAHLKTF